MSKRNECMNVSGMHNPLGTFSFCENVSFFGFDLVLTIPLVFFTGDITSLTALIKKHLKQCLPGMEL